MHILQARRAGGDLRLPLGALWGAILDGREEARQRALRRHRSDVHPIDGRVPTRAA
jgi:hypothetical protein